LLTRVFTKEEGVQSTLYETMCTRHQTGWLTDPQWQIKDHLPVSLSELLD